MGWHPITLPVLGLLVAGCTVSAVDLRDDLNLNQASFRDRLAAQQELIDEFSACTARPYDERLAVPASQPIPEAGRTSNGPLDAIHTLIARVKQGHPSHAESLEIFTDTLTDWNGTTYRRLDLHKLRKVVDVIRQWHVHVDFDEDALAADGSRFAQLLLAYNRAYFGDIRYGAGSGAGSVSGLRAAARLTSDGFIDRNGNVWRFPGLSVEVTKEPGRRPTVAATQVDSQRITADLTRVFLEAFFDAAFREPAVEGATALQVRWKDPTRPYPAFDADHPPIQLDALARVTRDALRAEAAVTSEVGKAVRGGSIFSTQNETVAASLETAAGVIAKKLVEHGGFCYFQTIQQDERRKEGIKK
ncbi:MAG TPA: hypothetical protein VH332_10930 [Nitrospira sp.]|jgi:hypothetical protein